MKKQDRIIDDNHFRCVGCGAIVEENNFYAFIRRRRCKPCQEAHRRYKKAENARKNRAIKSEERRRKKELEKAIGNAETESLLLISKQNQLLKQENQGLVDLIKILQDAKG